MNQKNLTTQTNNFDSSFTIKDLDAEFVELSEENLEQIVGGVTEGGPGDSLRSVPTILPLLPPPPPPVPAPEPWQPSPYPYWVGKLWRGL
jgi:hypothetical protein